MDKIIFLRELCAISRKDDKNLQNFELAMQFDHSINLFYEALIEISNTYNAWNEIIVAPIDFSTFTVPPGEFMFNVSKKVKTVIDCSRPIRCPSGTCIIRKNEDAAGYIVITELHQ